MFCVIGVYEVNHSIVDVWIMLIMGVVGYGMKKFGFDPAPLVLGLVISPIFEMSLRQSLIMSDGTWLIFLQRPISLTLIALCVGLLVLSALSALWQRRDWRAKLAEVEDVRAKDGPKTIPELIARAKASGKFNYGAGIITTRLAGYMFNRAAGIKVQLIPYKGSAEVVQGLLTGAVDYIIDGVASSLPLIKGGQFRALAKLNNRPLPALPDVPPLAEAAGMPELDDMSSWIALVAPAGTPRAIVERLQGKVEAIYADRATHDKLIEAGLNPVSSTPEEFDAFFRKEAVRWTKVFKESGIKFD